MRVIGSIRVPRTVNGQDGVGVASEVRQYHLSTTQSAPAPTSTGWQDDYPAYDPVYPYLYRKTTTTWTNKSISVRIELDGSWSAANESSRLAKNIVYNLKLVRTISESTFTTKSVDFSGDYISFVESGQMVGVSVWITGPALQVSVADVDNTSVLVLNNMGDSRWSGVYNATGIDAGEGLKISARGGVIDKVMVVPIAKAPTLYVAAAETTEKISFVEWVRSFGAYIDSAAAYIANMFAIRRADGLITTLLSTGDANTPDIAAGIGDYDPEDVDSMKAAANEANFAVWGDGYTSMTSVRHKYTVITQENYSEFFSSANTLRLSREVGLTFKFEYLPTDGDIIYLPMVPHIDTDTIKEGTEVRILNTSGRAMWISGIASQSNEDDFVFGSSQNLGKWCREYTFKLFKNTLCDPIAVNAEYLWLRIN